MGLRVGRWGPIVGGASIGRHVVGGEAGVHQRPVLLSSDFPVVWPSKNRTVSAGNRSRRDVAAAIAAIPLILLRWPHRTVYEPSGSICVPALSQGEASDFSLNHRSSIGRNGQNIGADGVIADGRRGVGNGLFLISIGIFQHQAGDLGKGRFEESKDSPLNSRRIVSRQLPAVAERDDGFFANMVEDHSCILGKAAGGAGIFLIVLHPLGRGEG